jgi:hypothetical protein
LGAFSPVDSLSPFVADSCYLGCRPSPWIFFPQNPMTDQHPITPPPELFKQWEGQPRSVAFEAAYRAGADQELEACCEWLEDHDCDDPQETAKHLRTARRPKPPSLKEQALAALKRQSTRSVPSLVAAQDCDIIRLALEQLND